MAVSYESLPARSSCARMADRDLHPAVASIFGLDPSRKRWRQLLRVPAQPVDGIELLDWCGGIEWSMP